MVARADRAARFDELIRANEHDLLSFLQRRTLNGADAADAFGELLLIAWRRRGTIPPDPVNGRMWLLVTARHVLSNHRRSAMRASEALQRLADTMRTLVPEFSEDDDGITLRAAVRALPADDAELIRLVYWDGFPVSEAASILGVNASTARSRLSRLLDRLRTAFTVDHC